MSRITLDANGIRRDGRWLHSIRDPEKEGGLWVSSFPRSLNGLVFVLGVGAGFHLRELHRQRPELTIVGCDFDREIVDAMEGALLTSFGQVMRSKAGLYSIVFDGDVDLSIHHERLLALGYSVFRFRPAWVGREIEFQELEDRLLFKRLPTMGVSSSSSVELEANIKSLTQSPVWGGRNERKALLALRELVT